jgi:hypothetical protein
MLSFTLNPMPIAAAAYGRRKLIAQRFALVLGAVILTAYPTYAQVTSGTVIVVNSSKDKLVVAADSRAVYSNGDRPPDDSQCKLATFDHKVLFATGGNAVRWRNSADDPVGDWRNVNVAGIAVDSVDASLQGEERIHAISQRWAELLVEKWADFYRWHPAAVAQMVETKIPVLTYGLFAQAWKGAIYKQFIAVVFNPANTTPIYTSTLNLTSCWACGQKSDTSLCAMGQVDVPTELCSLASSHWRPAKHQDRFDLQESLAIDVVDETSLRDLTKTVGGPTVALELTRRGKLRWLANPNHCP